MQKDIYEEVRRLREQVLTLDIRESVNHKEILCLKDDFKRILKATDELLKGVFSEDNRN